MTAGRPIDIPPCECSADLCPPIKTEENEMTTCAFCQIIAGTSPATVVREWRDALAIVPLGPVVEGHLLVIPRTHVEDWTTGAYVSAITMHAAAELAQELKLGPCNLITSRGREATQSVFHLHLHIVPRAENDGLALPWYSGKSRKPVAA